MWMPSFLRPSHASESCGRATKAVCLLGAQGLGEARLHAAAELVKAGRCPCCRSLLGHLHERLGSTLFLDDDPEVLAQAFAEEERDGFSARVLAACIVLVGRERVPAPV
jgi:hypothetical protein